MTYGLSKNTSACAKTVNVVVILLLAKVFEFSGLTLVALKENWRNLSDPVRPLVGRSLIANVLCFVK